MFAIATELGRFEAETEREAKKLLRATKRIAATIGVESTGKPKNTNRRQS